MKYHGIDISENRLDELCRKWKVKELSFLGSVLRDDFGPDSDIDVLVTFQPDAPWSLWDLMEMRLLHFVRHDRTLLLSKELFEVVNIPAMIYTIERSIAEWQMQILA
jgi:predicted nucleotidyltransferase